MAMWIPKPELAVMPAHIYVFFRVKLKITVVTACNLIAFEPII
jgi:hypothetical protein